MQRQRQGFECPKCGGTTKTTDSRRGKGRQPVNIRRWRACLECDFRFTTREFSVPDGWKDEGLVFVDKRRYDQALEILRTVVGELQDCGRITPEVTPQRTTSSGCNLEFGHNGEGI